MLLIAYPVSAHSLVKVAQSCPTLCDPMDYSVHGILQARILEWVPFPFSRGSSQPRDRTQVSCIAGRFFTSWATREAHFLVVTKRTLVWNSIELNKITPFFTVLHLCRRPSRRWWIPEKCFTFLIQEFPPSSFVLYSFFLPSKWIEDWILRIQA